MAIKAICVACGKPKKEVFSECKACGFKPDTDYQFARQVIFSLPSSLANDSIGRDENSLKALSKQIIGGRPYEFDPDEVEQALQVYQLIKQKNIEIKNRIRNTARALIALVVIIAGSLVYLFLVR